MAFRKRLIGAALLALGMMYAQGAAADIAGGTGNITWMYVYGDGSVLVGGINLTPAICSANNSFFIPGSNPQASRMLATLLAAKAQQLQITVNATATPGCWRPTIGTDTTTLISINQ